MFESVIAKTGNSSGLVETWSLLGSLLATREDPDESSKGKSYLRQASNLLSRQATRHNSSAAHMMWMGIAFLGLEDTGNAFDALSLARYMETRSFYQGMIELWLGKLADYRGDRETALEHYRRVLENPSGEFHRDEARRLIEHGYQ